MNPSISETQKSILKVVIFIDIQKERIELKDLEYYIECCTAIILNIETSFVNYGNRP